MITRPAKPAARKAAAGTTRKPVRRKTAVPAAPAAVALAPSTSPPVAAVAASPAPVADTLARKLGRAAPRPAKAKAPVVRQAKAAPAPAKPGKVEKTRKPKLVRDSFTIPKPEYAVLEQLKQRAGQLGAPIKKSELLRAGIKALAAMGDADYLAALASVPAIKTGRPPKS